MISVRHIGVGGLEQIHSAEHLHFTPEIRGAGGEVEAANLRLVTGEREMTLKGGTAFVMNEAGRTIAKYDLSPSRWPGGRDIEVEARPPDRIATALSTPFAEHLARKG